jgi:hypothetical protein
LRNPDVERSDAISDKKNALECHQQDGKPIRHTKNIE